MRKGTKSSDPHRTVSPKSVSTADLEVSRRIREQRMRAGLTQHQLAVGVGIAFQQIQKYENGTSRVSSGRLAEIARVLGVPVSSFFADVESANQNDAASMFLATPEARAVAEVAAQFPPGPARKQFVEAVLALGASLLASAEGEHGMPPGKAPPQPRKARPKLRA